MKILTTIDEIQSIEIEWNRIAEKLEKPYLCHEWFMSCAKALHSKSHIKVIVIKSNGSISAIAPFVSVRRRGISKMELFGISYLFEPSGLIYSDKKSLIDLINAISLIKKPIYLGRVRSDALEMSLLNQQSDIKAWIFSEEGKKSPWIPIVVEWNEYINKMSSKRRYDIRRAEKRAKDIGRLEINIISPDSSNVEYYLNEFVEVEAKSWKGQSKSAAKYNKPIHDFLFDYALTAASKGILRIGVLKIDDQTISVLVGIECFKRFWVLKIGYDQEYARCSPGIILIHDTIRYAFERKLNGYEFLGVDESWVNVWSNEKHQYNYTSIYPYSIAGVLKYAISMSKIYWRQYVEYMKH